MAEEFETQLVMQDAAGMVSGMSSNSSKLGRVADLLEQVLDRLLGNGGRVQQNGSVSGMNADLVSASNGESAFDISGLREAVSSRIREKLNSEAFLKSSGLESVKSASDTVLGMLTGSDRKTGLAGNVDEVSKRFGSLSKQLGTMGESFAGVSKLLGKFSSAIGIAATAMEIFQQSVDMLQNMKDISMSQTGSQGDIGLGFREMIQSNAAAFFTGLSTDEATAIQQGLIAGRVPFESDRYNEGYQFAQSARLNYTMDVNKAVDLYVKAVARGSMTVDDLNDVLESLAETARNTGATMDEVFDTYEKMSKDLERKYGGAGTEISNELVSQLMGLTPSQQEYVQNIMGEVDLGHGSYASERISYWHEKGYDTGTSYLLAARDIQAAGMGGKETISLAALSLGPNMRSVQDYIDDEDWDGLLSDLKYTEEYRHGEYLAFMRDLITAGYPVETTSSPEKVVETLQDIHGEKGMGGLTKEGEFGYQGFKETKKRGDYTSETLAGANSYEIETAFSNSWQSETEMMSKLSKATDFSDYEDESEELDAIFHFMVEAGLIDQESFKHMSKEEVYAFVRAFAQQYVDSGGFDAYSHWNYDIISGNYNSGFIDYLNEQAEGGKLSDSEIKELIEAGAYDGGSGDWRSEWSSSLQNYLNNPGGYTGANRDSIDVNVEVSLTGSAGEVLLLQSQEAQWKQGNDNAIE